MRRRDVLVSVVISLMAATACNRSPDQGAAGSESSTPSMTPATPAGPSVEIARPADGDTVQGPRVTVSLIAHGFKVVMAGDTTPNSGHHHLFLDREVSAAGEPIPAEADRIVHMGDGSSEHVFENVSPGPHRLIAVVSNAIHIPVQPWIVDTVRFTVR